MNMKPIDKIRYEQEKMKKLSIKKPKKGVVQGFRELFAKVVYYTLLALYSLMLYCIFWLPFLLLIALLKYIGS